MNRFLVDEEGGILETFLAGKASAHEVYDWWDCCLIDSMVSEEANKFLKRDFDQFDRSARPKFGKVLQVPFARLVNRGG